MISRRGFLRAGLVGGALLGAAALVGRRLSGYPLAPEVAARLRAFSPAEYVVFAAAARRILAGDGPDAPSADDVECALHVDHYVAQLPAEVQREVKALILLFEHGSAVSTRFTRMAPAEQDATLAAWESSGLTLKRRGFQALRTLAFLGYWRHERTWPLIGYTGPMLPRRT